MTATPCPVCAKRTAQECAHVDCPNRRPITAQPVGSEIMTRGQDREQRNIPGRAVVRRPHYFDE